MYKIILFVISLLFVNIATADIFSDETPTKNIPMSMTKADYADTFYRVEQEKRANPPKLIIQKDLSASIVATDKNGRTYHLDLKKPKQIDDILIYRFKTADKHKRYKIIFTGSKHGNTKKLLGTIFHYHDDALSSSDSMYYLNYHEWDK